MEFEEIHKIYSPKVFRLCMGYLNDPEQAKDLVQDTFISIWQNLGNFRNASSVSTWVFRIATNNCLRQLEKERKVIKVSLPFQVADHPETGSDDRIDFLYTCISELEEMERIIISMVLEELPQAEIASIVGLNEVNVRVKIHRIKEKLTIKFQKNEQLR